MIGKCYHNKWFGECDYDYRSFYDLITTRPYIIRINKYGKINLSFDRNWGEYLVGLKFL